MGPMGIPNIRSPLLRITAHTICLHLLIKAIQALETCNEGLHGETVIYLGQL